MPETDRDIHDILLAVWTDSLKNAKALIENVHSTPIQGSASAFTFGSNFGLLLGFLIAIGIPFERVAPNVWQKALGCQTKGDKNISKAKAQELFPHLKITHATADALLIGEYLRRKELYGT